LDLGRHETVFGDDESYDHDEGEPAENARPPRPEATGDDRVEAALDRLAELERAPVSDHAEVFEDVHQRLQDVLASVDSDEGPPPSDLPETP
jgi:hypothetical protein